MGYGGHHMRTPQVLQDFRRLVDAVVSLVKVLDALLDVHRDAGPAVDRLDALELSRHQFEAEMDGLVLKAEGKFKAANNAEARQRQLLKSYEKLADPLGLDVDEVEAAGSAVLPVHVAAGENGGVPAVRLGLATNNKTAAVNGKWQR